jgi:hypothetical protein
MMNILEAKWVSAMENAKELYDNGASIFACAFALDEARSFFELMKEAEAKKKTAEKKAATKPTFEDAAAKIGRLVSKKNKAYGDSFAQSGDVLKILYPNGIGLEQYTDMLALIRIIDKLFRIATSKDSFNENPYADIAGYAILKVAALDNEK